QKLFLPLHFLSALAATPQEDPFLHPDDFGLLAIARLAPGTKLASLNAQLNAMSPALRTFMPPHMRSLPGWSDAYLSSQSASRGFSEIAEQYSKPLLM